MEYLVVMTTRVPDRTSQDAIDDVRIREDAHSRDLASQGHLLRLWRPPLQPGEWRSLGLFAADDADELERVLASMPLRIWRTDEVTPLSRHPNDPGLQASPGATEYLTIFTVTVPPDTRAQTVEGIKAREAERAYELAGQGHLLRLWALPGQERSLGLWQAQDAAEMQAILKSLPLDAWMTVQTTPLTRHPSDPAAAKTPVGPMPGAAAATPAPLAHPRDVPSP
jgi:muconolactone delta-isomerase